MGINKIFIYIIAFVALSGCVQSTAMVGPAFTMVSTGNFTQAGLSYFTNRAVEEETGMQTHEFIAKKVEEQQIKNKDNKINKELSKILEKNLENKQLVILLQNNIKKTRNKLNSN